ncbi:Arylsulfatase [Pseudocercospora fuligena]|uniref:Arylsulfatase n=1 Tax=Pseudocercospora fuligena TaxID=685502 RepID=A0A8H6RSJ3_9PEZI|nr:Arylsulfatase [Pseudocercospora fuligena]
MTGWRHHFVATLSISLLGGGLSRAEDRQIPIQDAPKQPNIVFILTDDQDLHMDSLSYMPQLQKHITEQGTTFSRHYCTVALCCPSRVSLWTGKAAHNTNVTDVNPPYGGYPKFISQGFNDAYLPLWLQKLNYGTYYVGKLFNAQNVDNYASPHAAGWTGSEFLLDPYTYEYLNATFQRNHDPPVSYEGQYSTDVLANKSFEFLADGLDAYKASGKPFFLTIAPTAPHSNVHMNTAIDGNFSEGSNTQSPPISAERHAHLFKDVIVPRTPHFNPANPHGVSWISRLPEQNETNIAFNDHFYRQRLRSLQAVDEMIGELFKRLEDARVLDDTYVFFSTDNGYHIGQHRLQPGKQCPFEEDINIPFMVRGPGIAKGATTNLVTTHTDLAPTFLKLAGGEGRADFDGQLIPLHNAVEQESGRTEHVNVESWGVIMSEGDHGQVLYPNHTYKALRVIAAGYSLLYTVWCSGEHELYDLVRDSYEMENLYSMDHETNFVSLRADLSKLARTDEEARQYSWQDQIHHSDVAGMHLTTATNSSPDESSNIHSPDEQGVLEINAILKHLIPRLDALLMVLKTCKGRACTHPWEVLHPAGNVATLIEAMTPEFDDFYFEQQKVAFEKCEKGYILESEGPIRVTPYTFDDGS